MNPKVDTYIIEATKWQAEFKLLRKIILDCNLTEEFKWQNPCYTFQNNNIVLIHGFKEYCAILFMKGALLQDTHGILIQQTENVQSARQIRFTNSKEIVKLAAIIKAYIFEAIEVEKTGLKVTFKKNEILLPPLELEEQFKKNPALKKAFNTLTPGRQKAYNLYFSEAKQSATRTARIEKYMDRILNGKGLTDCVCGLSKRMPNCDGSHKLLK